MTASAASRHLVTTKPRRTTCPRCKRVTLEGVADGLDYQLDPAPITLAAEAQARIAGRMTYRLLAGRFVHRDHYDVARDTTRGRPPVAAAHTCTPLNAGDIELQHVRKFTALIGDPVPPPPAEEQEQHSLFVLTGPSVGAHLLAVPVDDPAPF